MREIDIVRICGTMQEKDDKKEYLGRGKWLN